MPTSDQAAMCQHKVDTNVEIVKLLVARLPTWTDFIRIN